MNRFSPEYKDAITEFVTENDIFIDKMGLPGRPTNQLKRNGYSSLKDIMFMTQDDLAALPAMGSGSVAAVLRYIDKYIESNKTRIEAIHSGDKSALWDDESIKDRILDLYLDAKFHGLSMSDIEGRLRLPSDYSEERLKGVIGKLIAEGSLEYVDYRLYRRYPSFRECLDKYEIKSSRNKVITKIRLDGETLESIGDDYGVTRERIRQIVNSTYKDVQSKHLAATGLNLFDEDYYKYFYETYEFDRKDGCDWFGIDMSTWKYLDLVDVKRGKKSLEEAETDQNLDPGLRIKIKNYNNRGKIFVDGMWVRKKRPDLEETVVRKYCTEDTSFTEFTEKYNDFVKEYGIEEDLLLKEELFRSRKGKMSNAKYLLWKQNEKLRYYDIDGRDYTELIDELGLQALENIEISTLKFVEDHADVLKRYDIRDQYELHNLLRKIIPDGSMNGFHCGRMPMISFGDFSREKAIEELVLENAPITTADLADLIHAEFGYDQATVIGTYLGCVSKYYHKGVYEVDFKKMPDDRKSGLDSALKEDGYLINEIRREYRKLFPDADPDEVNPFTLKEMGFSVFSRCVVRNHNSLEEFFVKLLTENEISDISDYKRRFGYDVTFTNTLTALKKDLRIIEFEPNQMISIERLERSGVTRADIRKYCDDVYSFVKKGQYFSAQSIVADGFRSDLYDLGFSDWFYANLLFSDDRFSHTRVFNNLILYKGEKDISVRSFQADVVRKHGSIDVYDFINELSNTYGCTSFDRYDVIEKIKNTGIYYDKILDRLYASIDVYEDELERMDGIW